MTGYQAGGGRPGNMFFADNPDREEMFRNQTRHTI